jgi:hypothetical protein
LPFGGYFCHNCYKNGRSCFIFKSTCNKWVWAFDEMSLTLRHKTHINSKGNETHLTFGTHGRNVDAPPLCSEPHCSDMFFDRSCSYGEWRPSLCLHRP